MTHCYATVDQFKAHLTDNVAGITTLSDASLLATLEGASRAVDAYLDRSEFGTGFGPRVASNRYEGEGLSALQLDDDLVGVTGVSIYSPPTESVATYTLTLDTDYYAEPYSGPPYRALALHGYGTLSAFPDGSRVVVAGTAASAPVVTVTTSVTMGTVSAAATSITVSAGSVVSAGHTIRYGTEDIYVTAVTSGTVLTVMRGQNGTTAAPVAAGGTAVVYAYPSDVVSATLAVAQRRRKSQDAGLTGDFGLQQTTSFRDTERSVLRAHVGHRRLYGAG